MTEDDRKAVLVRLTQLAEVFNRTLTREVWLAYVKALDDLPGQTVLRALDRCLQTCKRFPTPADVREQTRPEARTGPPPRALPPPGSSEPRVTRASMARILRETAARDRNGDFAPHGETGRVAWMDRLADEIEGMATGRATPGGVFGQAFARVVAAAASREPGDDDDDPTPTWASPTEGG